MTYKDLRVYQLARKLEVELCQALDSIPHHWQIPEVNDAKRSARSARSNIVEGFSRRYYPKDYVCFLNRSVGSSDETQDHVSVLGEMFHLSVSTADYFANKYKTLSIQIINLIKSIRDNN